MHYSTIDTLVIGEDNPREKNLFIILSNENFSIRLNNFFKNNNLYFVGDVVTLTKGEILRSPKTGQETVKELEAFLEKYNLRLSMDLIGWPPPNFDEHYKKYQDQKDTFINYENPKIDTLTIGENNPREKNLFIKLSDKEFSVRTNNFFNNNKLYYVGDLVTLTRRSILNSNNTGVKTVQEIQIFLDKHDLRLSMDLVGWPPPNFDDHYKKYQDQNDPLSNFWDQAKKIEFKECDFSILENYILKDLDEFLKELNERENYIFKKRLGFGDDIATLEELGSYFNVTRERIRQIEVKLVKKIPMYRTVNQEKLKSFLYNFQSIGFSYIFPKLNELFSNKNMSLKSKSILANNLIYFIEIYVGVDQNSFKTPEKTAYLIIQNFNKVQFIYKDLKFPIDKEYLSNQIASILKMDSELVLNAFKYLSASKLFYENEENKLYPIKISKKDEILSILNQYPEGISNRKLFNIINSSASKNFIENYHASFAIGSLEQSEYIFFGKNKIKSTKFGNFKLIDQNKIFNHIKNYLKERNNISNLNNLFDYCKGMLPDKVDLYDLRYLIKIFGTEYGVYFSGKSQAQTVSLGKKIRFNHRQELEHIINKSKVPLDLLELEKSFSGVNQLLRINLNELVKEGKVCRYDINEWWSNDRAYKNLNKSFEDIKNQMCDVINFKKYTSLTYLVEELDSSMSIFESRYYIESLIRKLIIDFDLKINIKSELVSFETNFKGMQEVMEDLLNENESVEINYEKVSSEINISFRQFKNFYSNFKYYN